MIPRRPTVRPASPWRFPQPATTNLDNGLAVDCFDLPGQAVIAITLLVDAPLTAEPREFEGVSSLTMHALDEGTASHPGAALTDSMESCGAVTAGAGARLNGAHLAVEVPASRLVEVLPLVAELVIEPAFAPDDVARLVDDRLLSIATGEASPPVCATKALYANLGDHRLARPVGGDAETVARLDQATLQDWHQAAIRPERLRVIMAGDLPPETVDAVAAVFGGWQPSPSRVLADDLPLPPVPTRQVVVVDRPSATQVSLRLGTLTPSRPHPDWPALQVANAVVGSMFGSRLNQVLREERGLTYGASSGLGPTRNGAVFMAQAECLADAAAEATRLCLDLLDVTAAPITDAETRDAIAYITGATPLRLDTADAIAAQAAEFALGGVRPGWFDDYMSAIRRVTADDATAAFARHVQPSNLLVALCGPAEMLAPQLESVGLIATVSSV